MDDFDFIVQSEILLEGSFHTLFFGEYGSGRSILVPSSQKIDCAEFRTAAVPVFAMNG